VLSEKAELKNLIIHVELDSLLRRILPQKAAIILSNKSEKQAMKGLSVSK
jgi:hypothetical protein